MVGPVVKLIGSAVLRPVVKPLVEAKDEDTDESMPMSTDGIARKRGQRGRRGGRGRSDPLDSGITLSEEDGVRYLHFGSPWVQGAMRIAAPEHLELDYVQRMMAWLLFLEPPPQILQLGLGAGSLTGFSHRRLPASRITVVERDPAVARTAREWFALPPDDRRLRTVIADADEYLKRAEIAGRYGVLQVDLYDEEARGPVLDTPAFYEACRRALAPVGMAVFNLFGEMRVFGPAIIRIEDAFEGRVLMLDPVPAGNIVVLAFSGPALEVSAEQLRARARAVAATFGLPTDGWLDGWLRADQAVWGI